ncbi:Oxidoreductase family, C-terminal alpha/beta domain [Terribacillus halophilus]|uniref:Oxidoreductase family, C-terminal alpha/beta domain n=1 Tax=Terribacillus halophilus TaxID=361279 RepID=A0A1G6S952_9BACI|nr:Gfo/Idh/MocA family oxidoreductase [Terribacillus halophilus]SDD13418.1 Oxidoreductase family, C-terminal alpha/beta domain [Terribacillus halophilus]
MKKYVLVGTGGRAEFYYGAMARDFKDTCTLAAFCDINQTRMGYANQLLEEKYQHPAIPTYHAADFDLMIQKEKPDIVIVTTIDRTHHSYIIRALELGCDVITEKPMTTDEVKCQEILDAIQRTGKEVRVTFNYRYAPHNTKIKELIRSGVIGKVNAVHFEWALDTKHGADYFRRWHRDKRNSGGLLVHKSTHHFDLVNFWLDTAPQRVYASGDLLFYGRENAEQRGETTFYQRAYQSEQAKRDPFALDLEGNPHLKAMYLDAEKEDGYQRDQSVFGDGISIEDTLGVLVNYKSKAILTYSLNAYLPWEGFIVSFNGTKGRIDARIIEKSYVNSGGEKAEEGQLEQLSIVVSPMFDAPYEVEVNTEKGGHGGGDTVMLQDLFGMPEPDVYSRAATHIDGAMSIMTGIAGNHSLRSGNAVNISELINL